MLLDELENVECLTTQLETPCILHKKAQILPAQWLLQTVPLLKLIQLYMHVNAVCAALNHAGIGRTWEIFIWRIKHDGLFHLPLERMDLEASEQNHV